MPSLRRRADASDVTQVIGLVAHNFIASAAGPALGFAFIRGAFGARVFGSILLFGGLCFFPALALGPIGELLRH